MKRLIVCCDGTWNKLDNPCPTNVVRIAQAIKPVADDGITQVLFYEEGLGTQWYDKLPGGAIGWGIDTAIKNAYRFLCFNYESGDEIYLFGFSRGAYTVRSLSGLIHCSGLLSRSQICHANEAYEIYRIDVDKQRHAKAAQFLSQTNSQKVPIALLGCWDTVGSLGIPDLLPFLPLNQLSNARYRFHNVQPIDSERASCGCDRRNPRSVQCNTDGKKSRINVSSAAKVWFPGEHGCVGGGTEQNRGLSDGALHWMRTEVNRLGLKLELDITRIPGQVDPQPTIDYHSNVNQYLYRLFGAKWRTIAPEAELHESVYYRWCSRTDYRPENLALHQFNLNAACLTAKKLSTLQCA